MLKSGKIAGYVNTERFSRRKKHPGVRGEEIQEVLRQANIGIKDVDLVQLINLNNMDSPDIPKIYGSTLKETWIDFWVNNAFNRVKLLDAILPCEVCRGHHMYHAALAFLFSPFDSGVALACDPVGTVAFFLREGKLVYSEKYTMASAGVYDRVSALLFGSGIIGAGKVMGLAPYGAEAGDLDYDRLTKMSADSAFKVLCDAADVRPAMVETPTAPVNATGAHYAQMLLEYELSIVLARLFDTCKMYGIEPNLCLSGGVALNSSANQRCFANSKFREIYLHPACGDDGIPIGAALFEWQKHQSNSKVRRTHAEAMYSCRTYEKEIPLVIEANRNRLVVIETKDYISQAAELVARGKVIGWFQGASEIGPRALGNRSIIADPRSKTMRDYLNYKIKKREGFRPFAPSVLVEYSNDCFGISDSPFMLRIAQVKKYDVPAVTHVDGTARFQTVSKADNPSYHGLISEFHVRTGVPMVLNTSFNGKGEPIVESPTDAVNCMFEAGLDALVFPGFILTRQP